MRPEIQEYNFDWMLGALMDVGSKVADGTEKEVDRMNRYVPYFAGMTKSILGEGRPGSTFLKILSKYFRNLLTAHDEGRKIAVTTFCFSPSICYALDVIPVTLEVITALAGMMWRRGAFDYLDYGCELGFTETSCSAQRGALGAYLAGLGEEIDFIVCDTPGVCDTNANAYAFAAAYLDRPLYQLNYPQILGEERSNTYHLEDYREMVRFMEKHSGNTLSEDRLREVLEEIDKQDALIADLEDMLRLVPTPVPTVYNLFNYGGRFIFSGWPDYTRLLEDMVESARDKAKAGLSGLKSGKEKVRAFLCYIDHYALNLDFWDWLDAHGIAHMGGILSRNFRDNGCYIGGLEGSTYSVDTTNMDTMLDSIAQMNARMPMVRSIRGPYDRPNMWLEESLALAKVFQVDCMIYNGTPGCRNTWGMIKPFAREMEKHGYPTHIMYCDAFDGRVESWEATAARLEEFFKVRGLL